MTIPAFSASTFFAFQVGSESSVSMNAPKRKFGKSVYFIGAAIVLLIAAFLLWPKLRDRLWPPSSQESTGENASQSASLVDDRPNTLRLLPDIAKRLEIRTIEAKAAEAPIIMDLPGTLILDADRLSHIHARFGGEIVEIGTEENSDRPLGFGSPVHKDQLLAVIWTRDLGEKKSELIDALSQLHLDEGSLERLVKASSEGAISERTIREAEHKVESGRIAVERVVRTLQSWRVSPEEIDALRTEAERLRKGQTSDRQDRVRQWARLEVRAPMDGIILERNLALGDLVDTNLDLFKIADLSRLRVTAQAYEEQLPSMDALPESARRWTIRVQADAGGEPLPGTFDRIGHIIDPNQHSATVMGWVENAKLRLRAGQFITARIELPPPANVVVIPASSTIEDGERQYVFVQADKNDFSYALRRVAIVRRSGAEVFVRNDSGEGKSADDIKPLRQGELVVSRGAVQLKATLEDLKSSATSAK